MMNFIDYFRLSPNEKYFLIKLDKLTIWQLDNYSIVREFDNNNSGGIIIIVFSSE